MMMMKVYERGNDENRVNSSLSEATRNLSMGHDNK
jgi:hypothetical protein